MARRGDIDSLPARAEAGKRGVQSLSRAFDDLSRTGKLSAGSIQALGSALFAAVPVAGALVIAGGTLYAAFNRIKEQRLAEAFDLVSSSAKGAREEFDRFVKVTEDSIGASAAMRKQVEALSNVDRGLAEAKQRLAMAQEFTNKQVKIGEMSIRDSNEVNSFAERQERKTTEALLEKRAALVKGIDVTKKVEAAEEKLWTESEAGQHVLRLLKESVDALRLSEAAAAAETRRLQMEQADAALRYQQILADRRELFAQQQEESFENQNAIAARSMAESAAVGAAADAYDAYADALDRTVSIQNLLSGSMDRTLRNIAASTIRNIGRQAVTEGSMQVAHALAKTAMGNYPAAAVHMEAAAAYFAVAAAAGAGAGLASVRQPGRGGGGGAGAGAAGGGGPQVSVTIIGAPNYEGMREVASWVQRVIAEAG